MILDTLSNTYTQVNDTQAVHIIDFCDIEIEADLIVLSGVCMVKAITRSLPYIWEASW
jgi:hypothetical protein